MLDIFLKNKIIFNFLKNYNQKKWTTIIPSLLEISILNLYESFKKYLFSEEELILLIENLKQRNIQKESTSQKNYKRKIDRDIYKDDISDKSIPLLPKNLKLNFNDNKKEQRDTYRSFRKNTMNINEINIYHNETTINDYNRNRDFLSFRKTMNNNTLGIKTPNSKSIIRLNNFNNFKKLNFKIKTLNNNKEENLDDINNSYKTKFNIYNSFNNDINSSLKKYNKKNNNKEYIKIYKNDRNEKVNKNNNRFLTEEKYNTKKNNYYKNKGKELGEKIDDINGNAYKFINNSQKENSLTLFENFNKKQNMKEDENKIILNYNNTNDYINYDIKRDNNVLSKSSNNSHYTIISPKKHSRIININKMKKYKNMINNKQNMKESFMGENKINQYANIKERFKYNSNITISKHNKKIIENRTKDDLIKSLNNNTITLGNFDDINIEKLRNNFNLSSKNSIESYNFNRNILKKRILPPSQLIKNNEKKIINYNSYNNITYKKGAKFLNDPFMFRENPGIKKFFLNKKYNNNID